MVGHTQKLQLKIQVVNKPCIFTTKLTNTIFKGYMKLMADTWCSLVIKGQFYQMPRHSTIWKWNALHGTWLKQETQNFLH